MDYKAKIAQAQAKMDELKAKISESADRTKAASKMKKEEIAANIEQLDAKLDALSAQIEKGLDEVDAAADLAGEEIDKKLDDGVAAAEGHINAAKENIRLLKERSESKINALKLKAQMNVKAAKEKIAEKKETADKSKQERRIADLLEYADDCQTLAYAMALEAEFTILEAAAEAADYIEKYAE